VPGTKMGSVEKVQLSEVLEFVNGECCDSCQGKIVVMLTLKLEKDWILDHINR
jgi:hypothetical protein